MLSFKDKLIHQRKLVGLSQTEIGEKIGRSKSVISNWERGISDPTHEDIVLLCNTLEVSLDFFDNDKEVIDVEDAFCRMVRGYFADPKLSRSEVENLFRNATEIFIESLRYK